MDTKKLLEERGKEYGDPKPAFQFVQGSYERFLKIPKTDIDHTHPANHAIYLILTKLSRLAVTRDHADSWDDIAAYAHLGKEISCGKENDQDHPMRSKSTTE